MAFVMGQPNMMKPNNLKTMQGQLAKKPKRPKEPRLAPMKPGRQFSSAAIGGILPKG